MAEGSDTVVREGGCGCGAVRYQVMGEPIFYNNCHCRLCQQQTGSTSVANAIFEAERITLLKGEVAEARFTSGSGGSQIIRRCSRCGCALWSSYPRLGELAWGLRAGTLDDPAAWRPDAVIFTESAMPWVAFPDDIPRFARTYDVREVIPPERFERMMLLVERRKAGEG